MTVLEHPEIVNTNYYEVVSKSVNKYGSLHDPEAEIAGLHRTGYCRETGSEGLSRSHLGYSILSR